LLPFRRRPRGRTLLVLLAGIAAVALPLIVSYRSGAPPTSIIPAAPPAFGGIEVIDGDTIRRGGRVYRLVGFDTPETGMNARCERERALGAAATRRLTELLRSGGHVLMQTRCACPPGTEGTTACNYGRLCARLTVQGRDVGAILISEGLARPFVCGSTSCPSRAGWC
jgi:micrococcal nuclease